MTKLKLSAFPDNKPVRATVILAAAMHHDFVAYADYLNGQHVFVAFIGGDERG